MDSSAADEVHQSPSGGVIDETTWLVNPANGTLDSSTSGPPSSGTTPGTQLDAVQRCTRRHLSLPALDLVTALICAVFLVFAVVYTLFGYRCFKAVMFLTGFIFGSVIVYLICLQEKLLPTYGNAGVALGAGILFGLITMLVQYVGLFLTGFHTGLLAGLMGLATANLCCQWQPASVWVAVVTLLASGLLCALLNLYCTKGLTLIGTAVYGASMFAASCDYFIHRWDTVGWVWERVSLKRIHLLPCAWYGWLVLASWPTLVILGMITQCAITGRGVYHHEPVAPSKKSRAMHPATAAAQRVRTREQRAELRQKKYRYLYQVRTAHGDVISQSYVQALQRKVCGPGSILGTSVGGSSCPGDINTLQSDSTHLTILPADHTQQQLTVLTESEDDEISRQRRSPHLH